MNAHTNGKTRHRAPARHPGEPKVHALADTGKSNKAIAGELRMSPHTLRRLIEREAIRRDAVAKAEPEIQRSALSMTARQKLDAALRQHTQKLNRDFELRVQTATKQRTDQLFPKLDEMQREASLQERTYREFLQTAKKLGSMSDWNNLMFCLHPDTRRSASDQKFDVALAWVLARKFAITGEK